MARPAEIERPDPDALLERVVTEESRRKRGKLTVFFGAAPGVGKTYAMLEVARAELEREKRDVVAGIVETHGRYDTGALTLGLELLPRQKVEHRGIVLEELDLDAALARKPDLILIDELAHTNAEGQRHPKRWQDVEELLAAGIDVFTTLNVQHVESLNDVIAQITGVVVRETVPDAFLEQAHAIKLVDLPPEDLLERLRDGKIYVPAQAKRALENFFREGNLIALRELALRHTAERVDAQMLAYRRAQGIEQTWAASDHLLVAVSPSPHSARLVRAARRMAGTLHARWYAVYVEPTSARPLPPAAQARLSQNLRLAEELGAEVVTLAGDEPDQALLRFAREHNVTKIIAGKPLVWRAWERLRGSLVDRLVRASGDIDVYVTAGDPAAGEAVPARDPREPLHLPSYLLAVATTALSTAVAWLLFGRDQLTEVTMVYLLGVVLASMRVGLGPSVVAALSSVAAFDFLFVPPYLTLAVLDQKHAITFAVMFVVGVVISGLTRRVQNQAKAAEERERRTADLYAFSRELARAREREQALRREVEAEQLRSSLLSSVSHDLRTPLAAITGAAGTLLEHPHQNDATRRELMQTVLDEAERLNRLIRNLLDMTRLDSGSVRIKKELVPLDEVVGAALEALASRLEGHDLRVALPPELPLVPCDPLLLEQALINLLENALKYGADPLELTATASADEVTLELADRGPGIPAGEAARIFDKFQRGAREGTPGGVGLGLAICRAIATAHGGRISASPRDGGGVAFRIALPLPPGRAQDGPP